MTLRRASGFTLIEMIVAVGILGIVVVGAMETFVVQNSAYTVVDETTEAQQNLRAISYLIERDLRSTGFMVEEGAAACGIDNTDKPDVLFVTDTEPINPDKATVAALGATVVAGYTNSVSEKLLTLGDVVLDREAAPDDAYFDTSGDGVPDSDFVVGRGAILVDTANPGRGTACGLVTAVNAAGNQVRVDFQTSITGGGTLVLIPAIAYSIDANATLRRNGMALATDVEDLQVAYFIDGDENGKPKADDSEYPGSGASPGYASKDTDHSMLREVRFNIVVRSRNTDPRFSEGFVQATENRGAVGANDGFRRRVFTSTVRPRNIGFRGVQASG
jgi:prepilin-type N-terminal cleavage/methylation domain-containing protein